MTISTTFIGRLLLGLLIVFSSIVHSADGKLLAATGVQQFEGSAGGGLVPWAVLAGNASRDEFAVTSFVTEIELDDFRLRAVGLGFTIHDRFEFGYAEQKLKVKPLNTNVRQQVFSVKARLFGDIVYSDWPQVSASFVHKRINNSLINESEDNSGSEFYIAITKYHLAALNNRNILWNLTIRATEANQTGLLGFGGPKDNISLQVETSVALQLNRGVFVGLDYRLKPDNLATVEEDAWANLFIRYLPNKHFNVTAAYLDFGDIAGLRNQSGVYFSLSANL
jgi:hypothetical protein